MFNNDRFLKVIKNFSIISLILLAINQIILSTYFSLSVWKGGGFGMFSAISFRFTKVYAYYNKSLIVIESNKINKELKEYKKLPTKANEDKIKKKLINSDFIYGPEVNSFGQLKLKLFENVNRFNMNQIKVKKVVIDLYECNLDIKSLQITAKKMI